MPVIKPEPWLERLMSPDCGFAVHPQFFGTAIRSDRWRCKDRHEPYHWLLLALEGRSDCRTGATRIVLEPGDLIWIPPDRAHDMTWSDTFGFAEVYFQLMDGSGHLMTTDATCGWRQVGYIKARLDGIADEIQLGGLHHHLRLRALIADLVIELWRHQPGNDTSIAGLTVDQQTKLARFARFHITEGLTPADLARHLDLSPNYFSRQFHRSFGLTPRAWLTRERLRAAADLIARSHLTVYQVADRFGYGDAPQFSRQFKRVMGVSPMQYRKGEFASRHG